MKARLHSRRYFTQIFFLTIVFLLVLCTFFTAILYTNSRKSTTETISRSESERTADLLRQSDIYLEKFVSICSSFASLRIPSEELSVMNNYWARMTFEGMLKSHITSNDYTQNIDVEISGNSISPSKTEHEKFLGKMSTLEIYTEDTLSWPYYFDLVSSYGGSLNAVTFTVSSYYLSKHIFPYDDCERLDYLLTEDGNILLTNYQDAFFQNIDQLHPGLLTISESSTGGSLLSYEDYYFVLSDPDKYGFRVLSLVPKTFYSHQYTDVLLQTALMTCVLLLVALLISFFLATRFYHPISSMVNLLQTYIQDDLHDYENEIAFIHQNVSKYVAKGKELETALSQTLTRMHDAQTAVLQHQINSHFLFNTLENIKAISIDELGIDNEIEHSIVLLNQIIHESVVQKTTIIPLSHELHLGRCYLELMQMRFPNVDAFWDVDETLLQCKVFKFSLQPVLENCFTHAFKGNIGRKKQIHIVIFREQDCLVMRIRDNGRGLDADSAKYIEQILMSDDEPSSSCHVGIRNVHNRITNVFGSDYGITAVSTPPGTTMEIRYPIMILDENESLL